MLCTPLPAKAKYFQSTVIFDASEFTIAEAGTFTFPEIYINEFRIPKLQDTWYMLYTFISNSTLPINRQLPAGLRALTSSCMRTKTASPLPHSGILQSDCWVQIASLILKGETLSTEMMKMSLLPSQKKLMNSIKLFGSSPLKNLPEYIFEKNQLT